MAKVGNATYNDSEDFPDTVPVFPLTGALLLPGGHMPLNIFEPRYLKMVSDAVKCHKLIGMVQPDLKKKSGDISPPPLSEIGCLGRITACQETGDGRLLISLSGVCRYQITKEVNSNNLYRSVEYRVFENDLEASNDTEEVDREAVTTAFRNYLEANGMEADWSTVNQTDTETLVTALCMMSPFEPAEKQALLEAPDLAARANTLVAISEFYLAKNRDADAGTVQ